MTGHDRLLPVSAAHGNMLCSRRHFLGLSSITIGPQDIYMFPRQDGILLGGTHERGNWNLEPDPSTTQRILTGNAKLFAGMRYSSHSS